VFVSRLTAGHQVEHVLGAGRGAYVYVIEGEITAGGEKMESGSAAQIVREPSIAIEAVADAELILVDVEVT
jgi:redox-sensitive bicupin YhaK (pirin superfamily)